MILIIAKFLAASFGFDITKAQKIVIISGIILIGLLILISGLTIRSCLSPTPKLDERQIEQAQTAVAEKNEKAMRKILVESDLRLKEIEANVNRVENNTKRTIEESRRKYAEMSVDELAAELERRK